MQKQMNQLQQNLNAKLFMLYRSVHQVYVSQYPFD